MTATSTAAAIALDSVTKTFSATAQPALTGVTLDVLPGSCTAILGPSGSGKSTLLRLIAGLEDPSGGRVFVNGADVTDVLPERRGIGMVFQRPLLFPYLNVIDNVAFSSRASGQNRRTARAYAMNYLRMVALDGFESRPVRSLSGGQEQRVAIARALAAQPSILLLDEPFGALDAALRDEMYELLEQIRRELSPTILLVTHDREEASAVADRIALFENGCLLQHATVEDVYSRPASLAVSRLLGGRNSFWGTVRHGIHESVLGRVPISASARDGDCYLVFRQESVMVAPHSEALPGDCGFDGLVREVRSRGASRSIVVAVNDAEVHAHVPPGMEVLAADRIRVTLDAKSLSVVPA